MAATIIDGKAIAARVREEVAEGVRAFNAQTGRTPGLATVLVGDDPASAIYVGGKQRASAQAGMRAFDVRLPADSTHEQVAERLHELAEDEQVSGILLQLPVPAPLDGPSLTELVPPEKDVDGLTPVNAGLLSLGRPGLVSATPLGVIELLRHSEVELAGAEAVVVGRSNLFGKPMAQLLLARDATVTVCHSRTRDLREVCARADVLIAAVGRPRLIGKGFIKPGAVVIDVGMNRLTPEEAQQQERARRVTSTTQPPWRWPRRSRRCRGAWGRRRSRSCCSNTLHAARMQAGLA